ncbi:MAG TPA: PaaI family thioesterase [Rhizomicrobium sp.]|nr:PaaI family thioesterase [Rhizomicrobium sp.]
MSDRPQGIPPEAELASTGGFNKYIGPLWRLPDEGEIRRFAFVAEDKHMNGAGTIHGGMLMSFADTAMSRTTRIATGAGGVSTVALNCDFVAAGKLGEVIEARVRITRQTRTMVFLSAELKAGGRTLLVATGLWKIAGEP